MPLDLSSICNFSITIAGGRFAVVAQKTLLDRGKGLPGHAKCLEREPPFDDDRDVVGTQDLLGLGDLYGYETSFAPLADVQILRDPQRVMLKVCRVGVREAAVAAGGQRCPG